jgi:TolB-like protein
MASSGNASERDEETGKLRLYRAARDELRRLLADERLAMPPRRREMLRYIVEETIAGNTDNLTAIPIAQTVFGRGERFDHQTDPVVRIEARRLRRDLSIYYADAGSDHPVRITIPKGRYVAQFERVDHPSPASGQPDARHGIAKNRWMWIAAGAVALVSVVALGNAMQKRPETAPAFMKLQNSETGIGIRVMPFEATTAAGSSAVLAPGMTQEIVTALLHYPGIRVWAPTGATLASLVEGEASAEPDNDIAYVLLGTLGSTDDEVNIGTRLVAAGDERVVWSRTYTRELTAKNLLEVQSGIAADIASQLGQSYGAIMNDQADKLRGVGPEMTSYECVLLAYQYRRILPGRELAEPVMDCLQQSIRDDPDYAEAWALLGYQYLDLIRFGRVASTQFEETFASATNAASRAVAIDPANLMGKKALATINYYHGNFAESERLARAAVALNPYDPDSLVQLGWRMAVRGHLEEGVPYIEKAIARSISPPGWYYHLPAVDRLMKKDGAGMLLYAQRASIDGSALSQSLIAMAHGLMGNKEAARQTLVRMNEITPGFDPFSPWRRHLAADEILDALADGMRRAGWTGSGS